MPGLLIETDENGDLWLGEFSRLIGGGMNSDGKIIVTALLKDQGSSGFAPMGLVFEAEAAMHLLALLQRVAEANGLDVPGNVVSATFPPTH